MTDLFQECMTIVAEYGGAVMQSHMDDLNRIDREIEAYINRPDIRGYDKALLRQLKEEIAASRAKAFREFNEVSSKIQTAIACGIVPPSESRE
jgi:hypothetical protein